MVKVRGVLDGRTIRLRDTVDLPPGTEVSVTIEPRQEADPEIGRRQAVLRRIFSRERVDIRPHTLRDLVEDGRGE